MTQAREEGTDGGRAGEEGTDGESFGAEQRGPFQVLHSPPLSSWWTSILGSKQPHDSGLSSEGSASGHQDGFWRWPLAH